MKLEIEEIAAPRSFVFLWCGSGEGLDLGRVVRCCFNSIYQGQAEEFIFIFDFSLYGILSPNYRRLFCYCVRGYVILNGINWLHTANVQLSH